MNNTRFVDGVEVSIHHHSCETCGKQFECNSYWCNQGEITTGEKLCDECYERNERVITQMEEEQARRMRSVHESIHEPY